MTLFGPHSHDLGRHFCSTGPGNWCGGARSPHLFSIRIRVGHQPAPDARRGMFTPTTPPSEPRRARRPPPEAYSLFTGAAWRLGKLARRHAPPRPFLFRKLVGS